MTRGIWALRSALRYPSLLGSTAASNERGIHQGGKNKQQKQQQQKKTLSLSDSNIIMKIMHITRNNFNVEQNKTD